MPSAYLVPEVLSRSSIIILVGASFSGKTSLIVPQLEDYAAGRGFLGYKPGDKPEQCGAIVCGQTVDDLFKVVRNEQFPHLCAHKAFPIVMMHHKDDQTDMEALKQAYDSLNEGANSPVRLLLIEDMQGLMASGKLSDPRSVSDLLYDLRRFCMAYNVTIIGTVLEAKMKTGESYKSLAAKVYGAVKWAQESSCLIGVEEDGTGSRHTIRRVDIWPRGCARIVRYADFDQFGHLRLLDRPDPTTTAKENPTYVMLDTRLMAHRPGTEFSKDEFLKWGEDLGVGQRTIERWLGMRCDPDMGWLIRIGNTQSLTYQKPFEN